MKLDPFPARQRKCSTTRSDSFSSERTWSLNNLRYAHVFVNTFLGKIISAQSAQEPLWARRVCWSLTSQILYKEGGILRKCAVQYTERRARNAAGKNFMLDVGGCGNPIASVSGQMGHTSGFCQEKYSLTFQVSCFMHHASWQEMSKKPCSGTMCFIMLDLITFPLVDIL